MRILVINGPNLNLLGQRNRTFYGDKTLDDINRLLEDHAKRLKVEVVTFQSNSEGALLDFIHKEAPQSHGIIINPAGLTPHSISLRDALQESGLPVIEVHLSNIHAREEWRARSIIAPIAQGQISGLKWRSYTTALEALVGILKEKC
ncbi:MAG: type II 3-dehydroquinate dehydratase [Chloroflexota bacterium]